MTGSAPTAISLLASASAYAATASPPRAGPRASPVSSHTASARKAMHRRSAIPETQWSASNSAGAVR